MRKGGARLMFSESKALERVADWMGVREDDLRSSAKYFWTEAGREAKTAPVGSGWLVEGEFVVVVVSSAGVIAAQMLAACVK